MATGQDVALTNEEIWDDSALVDSWNSALDEYKKYHSIHKKGGNVADLLNPDPPEQGDQANSKAGISAIEPSKDTEESAETASTNEKLEPQMKAAVPTVDAPALAPEVILGSVQDEGLKKLLMSWYYAGYYTGLYEGQRDQASR